MSHSLTFLALTRPKRLIKRHVVVFATAHRMDARPDSFRLCQTHDFISQLLGAAISGASSFLGF
jgi:hypothetical protein